MTPERKELALAVLSASGLALLISLVLIYVGIRRYLAIRRRMAELSAEHESSFVHINARMAAQKELVAAENTTGPERRAHLERALEYWREAYRARRVGDQYAADFARQQIKMIEDDLAAEPPPDSA
jgi:ABC-type transport system involved in cytochrome bd biosynthesis fused ATPase/permease subunit